MPEDPAQTLRRELPEDDAEPKRSAGLIQREVDGVVQWDFDWEAILKKPVQLPFVAVPKEFSRENLSIREGDQLSVVEVSPGSSIGRGGGEGSSNASTFRDQRTWTRNALLLAMLHYATDECPQTQLDKMVAFDDSDEYGWFWDLVDFGRENLEVHAARLTDLAEQPSSL